MVDPPQPGDEYFCFYCLHTTIFDLDGSLRTPTDEEWGPILARPVTQLVRAAFEAWHPVLRGIRGRA